MAFTADEKSRILFYLGYSVFEDDGPAMRAIHSLDSKESVGGFIIRELLERIEDVRRGVHQTIILGKAIEDGSIKLRVHYTLAHLWQLGRSYVTQLAGFAKVSIFSDIFSSSSTPSTPADFYSGDPSESRIDPTLGVPTR
jgi:hypothetical protein